MTEDELFDAMDGLMAWDNGCVDSGIKDEGLRRRVIAELDTLRHDGRSKNEDYSPKFSSAIGRYINRYYLNEEAIAQGYGFADLLEFVSWLRELMD